MDFKCFLQKELLVLSLFNNGRFVGNLLKGQTVGVIGAGRIGSAYARMMVFYLMSQSMS